MRQCWVCGDPTAIDSACATCRGPRAWATIRASLDVAVRRHRQEPTLLTARVIQYTRVRLAIERGLVRVT